MPQDQVGFYVQLDVQPEHGGVYISSKEVPGLHLIGKCFEAMKSEVERAMKRLYKDNHGQDINVIWLVSPESFPKVENVLHSVAIYPNKKAA